MKIYQAILAASILIFILASCQKDTPPENKPPVVNPGSDTTFQLVSEQNDTIRLSGSAIDPDGQIAGYAWSQISGPNAARIHYPGSATTKVSGVVSGQYVFQLMATDDKGATGVKSVKIVVQAPQVHTLTLQPSNNPTESSVYSYVPNGTGVGTPQIVVGAWTENGTPAIHRTYIKFNYTLPAAGTILSAKLSLYAMSVPLAGNFVDAHYGSANSYFIERITNAWSGTNISWNNQPITTASNRIIVPNSTSSFQNDIDIDVTQLVKDMQQYGNNGFAMRLLTETYYNTHQYVSSYNTDATKHPKLVIQYLD